MMVIITNDNDKEYDTIRMLEGEMKMKTHWVRLCLTHNRSESC